MAIFTIELPLRNISAVTNGNAYDVTIVGGADALTSQDGDSSYVRLPLRPAVGDPKSYITGTFQTAYIPTGATILDVDFYVLARSETGAFSFCAGSIYTGAYGGPNQSASWSASGLDYVAKSSGAGTTYPTLANLNAGLVNGSVENYYGTYAPMRVTRAWLRVRYSDNLPLPDGVPPSNQTIAGAIPLPPSGFTVDMRDITQVYGGYTKGVFYTYEATQSGNLLWWLDYAEDPAIWDNDLPIYPYVPVTESQMLGYVTTDSWSQGDEDPDYYPARTGRYWASSEVVAGTSYTLAILRSTADQLPAGPYTVRWEFTPDVTAQVGAQGGSAVSLALRQHNDTFPDDPQINRKIRFTAIALQDDGTVTTVESPIYNWPWLPETGDVMQWVHSLGPTGQDGLAMWLSGTGDFYGGRNKIVAHLVRYTGTAVEIGEPLVLLDIPVPGYPTIGGTSHGFNGSEHSAGGKDICLLNWQWFDDPDVNNNGPQYQRYATVRLAGNSLTHLDTVDQELGGIDNMLVTIGPNEALEQGFLYGSSPGLPPESTDWRHVRRITWDNDGNITLGNWVELAPDFPDGYANYYEYGTMDHIPGTRVALFYSAHVSDTDISRTFLSVRALNIDTLEAGPTLDLDLGADDLIGVHYSDAFPFSHTASASLLIDGTVGLTYMRFQDKMYYCLQAVMTPLFVDTVSLTVSEAGPTQVIRDGLLNDGYQDDGYHDYRTNSLNYGLATAWWYNESGANNGYDHFAQGLAQGDGEGYQMLQFTEPNDYYPWLVAPVSGRAMPPPNLTGGFVQGDRTFEP
jgi:hypothetical protein